MNKDLLAPCGLYRGVFWVLRSGWNRRKTVTDAPIAVSGSFAALGAVEVAGS